VTAPGCRFPHRAFQNVADAEFAADALHIYRLALIGKARIAGDDEQPADAAERGDDLLDHAVGEIFLLRVARHVLERQHRDRRLVGSGNEGVDAGCTAGVSPACRPVESRLGAGGPIFGPTR